MRNAVAPGETVKRGFGRPYRTVLILGLLSGLGLGAAGAVAPAAAADLDRTRWAAFLGTHTRAVDDLAGTRVDYQGLTRSAEWRAFVGGLRAASPPHDRAGRMAFWIDVYNVLAIDTVVRSWPTESIRDAGSFFRPVWGQVAGEVDGRSVTLHEIEHEILRPMGEPRIHMAIVCASTSCPSLAREPFDPARLDAMLDAAVRRFLADDEKGLAIDRVSGTLTLSRIFDWFDEDFDQSGGVRGFLLEHVAGIESISEQDRGWLMSIRSKIKIRHFDYDWTVNALQR